MDSANAMTADLRSDLANALAAKAAAEAGRAASLSSYARMYTATRILTKAWRLERVERQNADATSATVRCGSVLEGPPSVIKRRLCATWHASQRALHPPCYCPPSF
jgi:hypothetical protein